MKISAADEPAQLTPRAIPRLSVVVPIYNVDRYLDECLRSIAEQSLPEIEVIMVDDGSTDTSAEIAQRWCERDPRFRLIRQENHGLGHARNTGAAEVAGEYLAFLDSDDKITPTAYREMVETLDRTGSDFATGNVDRYDGSRQWQAPLCRVTHDKRRLATHVTRFQELLKDHLAHNKVWRTRFWRDHHFEFPVGKLYEDIPTTIPAHYRATTVDVLPVTTVLWRVREAGDASITQARASDERHLRDRMAAVHANVRFFAQQEQWELKAAYEAIVANRDLRFHVDLYDQIGEEYRQLIRSVVKEFLEGLEAKAYARITADNRIRYELLRRDAGEALSGFLDQVRTKELDEVPVVVEDGRAFLDHALRHDETLDLPPATFDVTDELALTARVSQLAASRDHIRLEGWAYLDRVVTGSRSDAEVELWLENGEDRLPIASTRRVEPLAAEKARPPLTDCEQSGFSAEIPIRSLWDSSRPTASTWTVMVSVRHAGIQRSAPLTSPLPGPAERPALFRLQGDWWLRLWWDPEFGLRCAIQRETAVLTRTEVRGDRLVLDLSLPRHWRGDQPRVELRPRSGGKGTRISLNRALPFASTRRVEFRPAELLAGSASEQTPSEQIWNVYIRRRGAKPERVLAADGAGAAGAAPVRHQDRGEFALHRNATTTLSLRYRHIRPRLVSARWDGADLVAELRYPADLPASAVVLTARRQDEEVAFPIERDGELVSVRLGVTALPVFGDRLPIRTGTWDLRLRSDGADLEVMLPEDVASVLPVGYQHRGRDYTVTCSRRDQVCLVVGSDLLPDERGLANRLRLATTVYPAARGTIRNVALYECYFGKQFSDSPRQIFQELTNRDLDMEHLVAVRDQQIPLPPGVSAVPYHSRQYQEALAQARLVVTNTHLPAHFTRAPGQLVLQTWHGVGTKRIGLDIEEIQFANPNYHAKLAREVAHWDYLISPNPFTSPILRRAFGYDGALLETGAPRNDIFWHPDREEIAAAVRRRLGIAQGQRVVLYAPTWRDNLFTAPGRYRLDLRLDLARASAALGEDYVLVFRKHSNVVDKLPADLPSGVVDASDYPDVQELLLITDILVSDYSTLMLDFAATGRPMLFYTYDLAAYRDTLRGFYFDFEAEVPGPLIADEADIVPAIREATELRQKYDNQYRRFAERFCVWDDGGAGARVADVLCADLAR